MDITWWLNDQPWSLYIFGFLAWPLSTFSVSLPSLKCMTDILFSPSISSLSLSFQVCWWIRLCMIRSRSNTWLNNLSLISRIRIQLVLTLPSSPCVPYLNTGEYRGLFGACSPRSVGQEVSNLLIKFLQTTYDVWSIFGISSISSSSFPSFTTSSATSPSSEAGAVTMGAFPLTRGERSAGSTSSSSSSTSAT